MFVINDCEFNFIRSDIPFIKNLKYFFFDNLYILSHANSLYFSNK